MRIAIIGAGGIGSHLAKYCHDLVDKAQFSGARFDIFDDDSVDVDNILYQDFENEDILSNKALTIANKYPSFNGISRRFILSEDFDTFDLIVLCVDNSSTRREIFNACFALDSKEFLDLRSEGTTIAAFTKKDNTLEYMLNTLPKVDKENGSCQLASDKKNKIIQQGNKIIAVIGSQIILNYFRNLDCGISKIRMTL